MSDESEDDRVEDKDFQIKALEQITEWLDTLTVIPESAWMRMVQGKPNPDLELALIRLRARRSTVIAMLAEDCATTASIIENLFFQNQEKLDPSVAERMEGLNFTQLANEAHHLASDLIDHEFGR